MLHNNYTVFPNTERKALAWGLRFWRVGVGQYRMFAYRPFPLGFLNLRTNLGANYTPAPSPHRLRPWYLLTFFAHNFGAIFPVGVWKSIWSKYNHKIIYLVHVYLQ